MTVTDLQCERAQPLRRPTRRPAADREPDDRAGRRAEAAPHGRAGRVRRQPDHAVGHVGDLRRQGDRAPVGADRDRVAVGDAERLGGAPCRAGPPAAGRCRPGARRRRQAAEVDQVVPGGQHRLARRRAAAPRPARPTARPAATARVAGSAPSSRRTLGTSARAELARRAARPARRAPGRRSSRRCSAPRRTVRSRPSQSRKRAGLLDHRGDRQDHVGPAGHRADAAAPG